MKIHTTFRFYFTNILGFFFIIIFSCCSLFQVPVKTQLKAKLDSVYTFNAFCFQQYTVNAPHTHTHTNTNTNSKSNSLSTPSISLDRHPSLSLSLSLLTINTSVTLNTHYKHFTSTLSRRLDCLSLTLFRKMHVSASLCWGFPFDFSFLWIL